MKPSKKAVQNSEIKGSDQVSKLIIIKSNQLIYIKTIM